MEVHSFEPSRTRGDLKLATWRSNDRLEQSLINERFMKPIILAFFLLHFTSLLSFRYITCWWCSITLFLDVWGPEPDAVIHDNLTSLWVQGQNKTAWSRAGHCWVFPSHACRQSKNRLRDVMKACCSSTWLSNLQHDRYAFIPQQECKVPSNLLGNTLKSLRQFEAHVFDQYHTQQVLIISCWSPRLPTRSSLGLTAVLLCCSARFVFAYIFQVSLDGTWILTEDADWRWLLNLTHF